MAFDTNRVALVTKEYRYATQTDSTVKDRFPKARTVTLDSQLNEAFANIVATATLAANDGPRVFEAEVEGVIHLDMFVDGPPSFILNAPAFDTDGRVMTLVSCQTDYETMRTVVRLRG